MTNETTTPTAVGRLVDILIDDQVNSYLGDSSCSSTLSARFREGFKGFANMTPQELVACAVDSGIDQREADLIAEVERLIAAEYADGVVVSDVQTIGFIDMQEIVGDYDVPEKVPEWIWVERESSLIQADNGKDGVWEFGLNLSLQFTDIPEKLVPVIEAARLKKLNYLVFHQGT